jgi:hypothetical protein
VNDDPGWARPGSEPARPWTPPAPWAPPAPGPAVPPPPPPVPEPPAPAVRPGVPYVAPPAGYPYLPPPPVPPPLPPGVPRLRPARIEPVPGTQFGVAIPALSPTVSGLAVGSMVAGIGSDLVSLLVLCFGVAGASGGWGALVAGAFAALAFLLGGGATATALVSRRQIAGSGGGITGRGLALTGSICGLCGAGLAVLGLGLAVLLVQ